MATRRCMGFEFWRLAAICLLASTLTCRAPREAHRVQPPNIVLMLVDDLGWQDISLPLYKQVTPFNRRYRTPNVERLAAEGVAFTSAYASAPVCTPTRTSLMTGKDPARTHITYWTLNKDRDTSAKHPTLLPPAWRMNGLGDTDVTLPKLLHEAGYRTIHVGKAHFGAQGTSGADPLALGFDVNIAGHAAGAPASYYGLDNFSRAGRDAKPGSAASIWDVPGLEPYHGQDIFLTEALTAEVLPAMGEAHASGQPFYLNFCPYAVHAPIMANPKWLAYYPDIDPREAAYATMIESCDRALGAVLDELEALGIADQTLVVFSSDNGGLSAHGRGGKPHTHNAPLRSGKGSAYEGGVRVPAVIRWPGVARVDVRVDTPIITQDFFTTFVRAAGARLPAGYAEELDGRDLRALCRSSSNRMPPRLLGWHQPHQWGASGPGIEPYSAIRWGDLKLIWFHAGGRFELYDLARDIGEEHDLAPNQPDQVRQLAGRMQAWLEDRGAQLSIDRETGFELAGPLETWLARAQ